MKLEENLKAVKYIRECVDLKVTEDGFVVLPAWQFALFVRDYEDKRQNNMIWFGMFLLALFMFVIFQL